MNAPFLHLDRDRLNFSGRAHATIALVVPVHNEQDAIGPFLKAVREVVDPLAVDGTAFEFIFVNDGSNDATLERLIEASRADPRIRTIDLSRNFGKEAAMTAGLDA